MQHFGQTRAPASTPRHSRRRAGWIVAAAVVFIGSCGGGGGISEGGDCQVCRETEPRCDTGLSCRRFQGNFTYALCAKPTTTSCPVPF